MPYEIRGNSVYKKDTGKLVGHSTKGKVKNYLKALYANSPENKKRSGLHEHDHNTKR